MAEFDVRVRRIRYIEKHPNADRLEMAVVDGFRVVVPRGEYRPGEAVVYLPEASVLPPDLIERLGLTGKLAGPELNRIHPVRLRGMLSQGICMKAEPDWNEGLSVRERLGIVKYEQAIPDELKGVVYALEEHERQLFDIENIKAYPDVLRPGEPVVMTEKIHGLFMAVVAVPPSHARFPHRAGRSFVSSKGLWGDRMAFANVEENAANPYVRAAAENALHERVLALSDRWGTQAFILAEVFGNGVQDLGYGGSSGALQVRAFAVGRRQESGPEFLDDADLELCLNEMGMPRVPVLYRGPFSEEILHIHTTGREQVSGSEAHLREGVVVTPARERSDPALGRVILKSVSEDYLLRKGGTEYR